jgi:O-succinylhomoserine sulfhydrylase
MAAVLLLCMALLKSGDHVVCSHSVFGSTHKLLSTEFAKFGVQTTFVSQTDIAEWKHAIQPNTRLLFAETPTNPLTEVCDIRALADIAHAANAVLAVDNCFCTPALQTPIAFGADVIVHSGTKYLDGQGRVVAGALCASQSMVSEKFIPVMRSAGMSLSPFNAWVVLKGLETLSLRMKAQSDQALALATWLEQHPKVAKVHFPGLSSHPQHALAKRQMRGFGGIVTARVKGGLEPSRRFLERCELFTLAESLGGVESLIEHPAIMTHASVPPDVRAALGIDDGLVRLSVGIEDCDDLIADLAGALS